MGEGKPWTNWRMEMTEQEIYLSQKQSTELIDQLFKKVDKTQDKYGPTVAFAVLATVGQMTLGMAMRLHDLNESEEKTRDTYDFICSSIWESFQNYKITMPKKQPLND
jgi:hypothetical protein